MFGSSNPFGQASGSSSFGTQNQSVFGQRLNTSNNNPFAQQPFDSSTPFGPQTGSSMFGGTSTGMFGAPQTSSPFGASSQAFCNSTPPFGASSTSAFGNSTSTFGGSSTFGQKSFDLSTPLASSFGSTTQQSQPAFGNYSFGNSNTPAFGASSTSAFGSSNTPAFGNNAFGSGGAFGASSTPAFGASSSPSLNFGSSPAFGQSTSAFGSTPFGSTQSSFGVQGSNSMFGYQSTIGGQQGGSRIMPYPQNKRKMFLNLNLKKSNPEPQNVNKGKSHTSMPPPSPQIPLHDFSEGDVPRKDQSNSNGPEGTNLLLLRMLCLTSVSQMVSTHKRRMVIAELYREFTSNGEKPLPSFDEWDDPHARELYVRNSIQQAKVTAGFNDTVRYYESALKRRVPLEDFAAAEKSISDLQMKIKSDASLIGQVDQLKKERDNALDSLKLSQEKINLLVHELNAMRGRSVSRELDELKRKYDALLKSSKADRERSTDERSHCRGLIKEIANHFDSLKARMRLQSDVQVCFEKKDFNLVKEEMELLSFEDPLGVPPEATQCQTSSRIVEESPLPVSEEGLPNEKNSPRASSSRP